MLWCGMMKVSFKQSHFENEEQVEVNLHPRESSVLVIKGEIRVLFFFLNSTLLYITTLYFKQIHKIISEAFFLWLQYI